MSEPCDRRSLKDAGSRPGERQNYVDRDCDGGRGAIGYLGGAV